MPRESITQEETNALVQFFQDSGWKLPYGIFPGSFPGGVAPFLTKEDWESYEWNPPQYLKHLESYNSPDGEAWGKPTWESLDVILPYAMANILRIDKLAELDLEATTRITGAYEQDNFNDEVKLRLGNRQTTEQDEEKDRLRTLYATLKNRINTSTLEELEALDLTDDVIWVDT